MTFTMWGLGHFLFMLSPFLLWFLLHRYTMTMDEATKRRFGIILSCGCIVILALRNIEIFVVGGYVFDFEIVPFQICHFANFVLLFAFLYRSDRLFAFAWVFNLPAAYLSIVFANSLTNNYETILNFRGFAYISGHMLIVALTLWAFSNGFVKLDKRILVALYKLLLPLYLIAHLVNMAFRIFLNSPANYFYTTRPELGTPLEWFYAWGNRYRYGVIEINVVYLVLTAMLGFLITLLLFFLTRNLTVSENKVNVSKELNPSR